jgi:hypothetical protein
MRTLVEIANPNFSLRTKCELYSRGVVLQFVVAIIVLSVLQGPAYSKYHRLGTKFRYKSKVESIFHGTNHVSSQLPHYYVCE